MAEAFLKGEDVDRLGLAIMTLARELWVVKDRVTTLESYLERLGTLPPAALDKHHLTEKQSAELQMALDQFVASLASQMSGEKVE